MTKRARLLVAATIVLGGTSVVAAPRAHACFNPDEPTCMIARVFCNETDPVAKYRDKVMTCYW